MPRLSPRPACFSLPFARQGIEHLCRGLNTPCRTMRRSDFAGHPKHFAKHRFSVNEPHRFRTRIRFFPVFSSAQGKIALRPHTEKYLAWGVEDNGGGRLLGVELV